MEKVEKLKLQIFVPKIRNIEDVQAREVDIEGEIDEADRDILRLYQYVQNAEVKSENKNCKEETKIRLKEQREEELYFERCKLEQQA